jgi:hypothetical protein
MTSGSDTPNNICQSSLVHWLQALGAKRRLLVTAAGSSGQQWMSATVSLAPPYGNLPYVKLLDTLVAKDALSTGSITCLHRQCLCEACCVVDNRPPSLLEDC